METKKISYKKKKDFDFIQFAQSYGYQASLLEASIIETALQLCNEVMSITIVDSGLVAFSLDQEIVFTGNQRRYRGKQFKIDSHKKLYAIDLPHKVKGVYLTSLETVATKKMFDFKTYSPRYEQIIEDKIEDSIR